MDAAASPESSDPEAVERSRMSAHEVSWSLRAVNRAASDVDRALAGHLALRPLEYEAMDHILAGAQDDPLGPVELAGRLGISPGSATEMVDRLERAGHVERRRGERDRRRVLVSARPEAVTRMLGDLQPLFTALDELAESLSSRDQRVVQAYLRNASALLERYAEALGQDPHPTERGR